MTEERTDMPEPRRQIVTETLMRHGHYTDPETWGHADLIEWMLIDADAVLGCPSYSYEEIDAALLDTGLHSGEECRDVCVRAVMEALNA